MKEYEGVIEMLPGDLARIAEVAGVEAAVRIAKAFRGSFLYVAGLDEMMRVARDAIIKKDYDGGKSARALAKKHGITERQIRKILRCSDRPELPEEVLGILYGRED